MVCFAKRAALALAVVSVSSAAFGQVLTLGGTSTFGAPYATLGGTGAWETYLKYNDFAHAAVRPAFSVVGSNVAGNGTQVKFTNQFLGGGGDGGTPPYWGGSGGATGQTFISPTIAATGYAAGAYQTSKLMYLKSDVLQNPALWGTSGSDVANGHINFDFRLGFVQDGAGFVTAGNKDGALASPGHNMDPDGNDGSKAIFIHYNVGNIATLTNTTTGTPPVTVTTTNWNNWTAAGAGATTAQVGFMQSGVAPTKLEYPVSKTWINSGTPSADTGVKYDGAMEVSGKMFADPVNAGMVIAQVKMGGQISQFSFDPTDARFGGTFDWQNAKTMIYLGSGGWSAPVNDQVFGIMSAGDANVDGNVDLTDLTILANNWNTSDKSFSAGDFSQDGLVDLTDLTILAGKWNSTVNLGQAMQSFSAFQGVAVPEPTSLGLVTLGAVALLRRRRA